MATYSGSKRILNLIVPTVVLLLSVSTWAADAATATGRASLELQSPASVAGTSLQSGKYRVEWTGNGEQVDVKIYRGNKEVVSTQARVSKNDTPYDHLSYTAGEKGAMIITQMSFAKQKCTLRLENAPASSEAQQAAK